MRKNSRDILKTGKILGEAERHRRIQTADIIVKRSPRINMIERKADPAGKQLKRTKSVVLYTQIKKIGGIAGLEMTDHNRDGILIHM